MIAEEKIEELLRCTQEPDRARVQEILARAKELKGLSLEEVGALLQLREEGAWEEVFAVAGKVKDRIYGRRVVLFAPLYVTNECINNCQYCGFRRENRAAHRKTLTPEEMQDQTALLLRQGHKRLLLVFGEHPRWGGIEYAETAVQAVYGARCNGAKIRRINVNLAPLSVEDFRRLKATGIGTYQVFQETYHRPSYRTLHPSGPKADYDWRMSAFDRALAGGIDDVGMGVLFGLYDYRFEVLSLLEHIHHLERVHGIGPHTISFPRVKPAPSTPLSMKPPAPVSEFELKKIVALLRLAVPYTGLILSTREAAHLRDELFHLGVSQISA
ncbi:MAG: [FeFe] hydrogenase H-cluster radical SAM maturase HydG, partial [candidate division NC10 bacterium]|nr:[FeFe] hydrogenase H-cluster radical SAM maturase HydG [candidate division NC10 bacterium]